MPEGPEKKALTIDDYAGFLRGLADAGFDFLVIGGIAVGGYLRLQGQELFSGDLDLYTTQETLDEILSWAPAHGARVLKRPQPRSIPTAFLEWDGKEVNVLTHSFGLPPAAKATQFARIFTLTKHGGLEVLLADPYDLLVNKLHVNRPKDQPHIELLRRFIEEECVGAFANEDRPRARLEPSRRLLATTKSRALPERLADRLIPLAKLPPDFRFLANTVPAREQADRLLERARGAGAALAVELEEILKHRRFPRAAEGAPGPGKPVASRRAR